jgi:uncharacterized protein (DUF305 family)
VNAPTRYSRLLGAAFAASTIALPGCSTGMQEHDSSTSAGQEAAFNDADIAFAQGMIPHHEQAIEMAQLAEDRAGDPRISDLATRIEAAQAPELDTLEGWLADWGAGPSGEDGHGGHDGGHSMGTMSQEDMDDLGTASGAEFDSLFLELMIEHHTGAVEMAETELNEGEFADALEMAESIRTGQAAEITEMDRVLDELAG